MTPETKELDITERKKQLGVSTDMILDLELKHALKIHNMQEGLDAKDAGLIAGKTLNKFRIFLSINFKTKYLRLPPRFKRQRPGPEFVNWCFKSELVDYLSEVKNVEQLKETGLVEIEFNNVELAAIKECFLALSSQQK